MNDPSEGKPVSATDRLEDALVPIRELPHDLVPEAGGVEIEIYDGARHDLRYVAIEHASYSVLGFLICLVFLVGLMPSTPGFFAWCLVILGTVGGTLGLLRGIDFGQTMLQLARQQPRLCLPEGVTEDDARFEIHSHLAIDAWNKEAALWNIDAGDLRRRYLTWAARTFREERLKQGLTPTAALEEYATLLRESERLSRPGGSPKGRGTRVHELRELIPRWIERTFDPKAIEDGLTPEQARIEYEAFAREAAALAGARAATEARGEKIRSKLRGFGLRLDTGKVSKLLPEGDDEPETVIDADDLPKPAKPQDD